MQQGKILGLSPRIGGELFGEIRFNSWNTKNKEALVSKTLANENQFAKFTNNFPHRIIALYDILCCDTGVCM